ncbi:NAD-binding protein [Halomicrococcus sp. NG-SE-24]|uniref:NAD-binding protein n=1 Tax=Halomicrococcus sp. NG-SE-24 TaxID=3436928 RepID=UPI003D97ADD4
MPAITDRIMSIKQTRLADEKLSNGGIEAEYFVLGGAHLGTSIARRLHAEGHPVSIVDETHDSTELPGLHGNPENIQVLEEAGVSETSTVIVATSRDSRNLLIAQLVRVHFDVSEILVLVNTPDRYDLVAEVGHEPICATTVLSDTVLDSLENMELKLGYTA